jgi:hypothetical protein
VRRMLWVLAATAAGVLVMSAPAPAAGWNCSASALSGPPIGSLVTANAGATTCKAASGGLNLPALPLPLQASVMSARTTLDGSATAQEQAQPQAVSHLHAAARGGPEPVGDAPRSVQAAGVPPESDPLPVAALAACGSS